MAFTTSKIGLRVWNLLTDLYDHAQLADNFAKIDYHDHSPGKGVQIPTDGLADGAVTSVKIASVLDPSGAYGALKPIARMGTALGAAQAAGTYMLASSFGGPNVLGGSFGAQATAIYLDPDDWATSGRTVMYRMRTNIYVNAVAPTATYAISLFPIATWGGASGAPPLIATIGAAVTDSTVTFVAPVASTPNNSVAEFTAPAAGWYSISIVQTGAAAAGSIATFSTMIGARAV